MRRRDDEGFLLLETLVAISLISVVMAAFTTFFVNAVASTNQQRATQAATQIANSGVDTVRSVPASDLLAGASSLSAPFPPAVSPCTPGLSCWVASMTAVPAPSAGTPPTTIAPLSGLTSTVNNVRYTLNTYLGTCVVPSSTTVDASCGLGASTTGVQYLRAVVAVTWAGAHCPPGGCSYFTATLISGVDDPLFDLNAVPSAAPTVTSPGDQTSEVNDPPVNLQLVYTAASAVSWTYTGNLPAGLNLDASTGRIIGTPTAVTSSTALTFTVTDVFSRFKSFTFNWTVLARLGITAPGNQSTVVGTAISPLTVIATGGKAPYTWSDPTSTLPPGLALSAGGQVTGTPTTVRDYYTVTLTVTDATATPTHSTTTTFTWTVTYPPFAATNPGAQTSTMGTADTVVLSTTGGSRSFTWTGGGTLPAGLTLTSAGVVSGTPTAAGTTSVSLVATDNTTTDPPQTVAFNWTVYARPTVVAPGTSNTTLGATVNLQLATTCANAPCSYVLNNGPGTLAISSAGLVTGTITGTATTYSNATFTVTDNSGATATTAVFTVVVNPAPTITNPGNQTTLEGAARTLSPSISGGTSPFTYSAVNLPSWLTLNTSTGVISGTAPSTPLTTTNITVTVRDAANVTATTAAFNWVVGGPPPAPTAVTATSGDGTLALTWTAPASNNGAAVTGYTATASPGGATCTASAPTGCTISGLTNMTSYTVTVTATNSFGTGAPSTAVSASPHLLVPGAPTSVAATAGDTTATITWAAPAANGSSAVTGYTATVSPGGASCSTSGALTCTIAGLVNATAYTVTVLARNGVGPGPASSPPTNIPRFTCKGAVVGATGANSYLTYPFAETSGTAVTDVSGNAHPGTYANAGVAYSAAGPCPRDTPASKSVTLNGSTGYVTGAQSANNPQVFSVGIWFKTSVAGGQLIGLGNQPTGLSANYDRLMYVNTAGKLTFGVYVNGNKTITSASAYNNNAWHYAVASVAPSTDANPGMRLYVDGALVANDTTVTSAETVAANYWRIGYDNLNGWPAAASNFFFTGSLAFASTYTAALTPAQILAQYHSGI